MTPPPFVIQLLKYLFETPFLQEYVIISPRSLTGRSWLVPDWSPCTALYSHLQPSTAMFTHVQLCTAMYNFGTVMYRFVQPCTALVQPCTIFFSYVQSWCSAIHGLVQYCIAMYSLVHHTIQLCTALLQPCTALYSCHVHLQPRTILYNHVHTASLFLIIELTNFAFYSINITLTSTLVGDHPWVGGLAGDPSRAGIVGDNPLQFSCHLVLVLYVKSKCQILGL